tara:strand:+ start:4880 stop:5086 length:207 start_codon:yes stop_codon:yes gene_type:complete
MKILTLTLTLLFLTNCSSHSVKLGKKCTELASDNTYEKSVIWIVDKDNLDNFNRKINEKNCEINGDNS